MASMQSTHECIRRHPTLQQIFLEVDTPPGAVLAKTWINRQLHRNAVCLQHTRLETAEFGVE
eukprot:3914859-Amphidinium_carterae.1